MSQTTRPGSAAFVEPAPLQPGAKVITLWPSGSPMLKKLSGWDQPENFKMSVEDTGKVQAITNIHNPSVELHLAPPEIANGTAMILAAGGGNVTLNVGTEGTDIAKWLNPLGVSCFIVRYRLKPYDSATDALADTRRCIRMIRANAKEWNIDPNRVGIAGFSAGGEQALRLAVGFEDPKPDAADLIDRQNDRPDFIVLVYAGWPKTLELNRIPKNAPPAFCAVAGIDDYDSSSKMIDFTAKWMAAKIPTEIHIYGHGGHANGIKPRNGIPFGTWHQRWAEWMTDMGLMKPATKQP